MRVYLLGCLVGRLIDCWYISVCCVVVCSSIDWLFICLSVYECDCLSVCSMHRLSVYVCLISRSICFVCMQVCVLVYVSVCLFVCLFDCLLLLIWYYDCLLDRLLVCVCVVRSSARLRVSPLVWMSFKLLVWLCVFLFVRSFDCFVVCLYVCSLACLLACLFDCLLLGLFCVVCVCVWQNLNRQQTCSSLCVSLCPCSVLFRWFASSLVCCGVLW